MKIYLLDRKYSMVKCWNTYFSRISDVEIVYDDFFNFMTTHKVECVVSPANAFGLMDGGYDLAITKWFGCELMKKVQKYITENFWGEQPVATSFLIDTGYKDIKLIHTPTMREPEAIKEPLVIYQCMRTTLIEAIKHNVDSIVIPAFGGACGGLDYNLIAKMMFHGYSQVMLYKQDIINWDNHLNTHDLYKDIVSKDDDLKQYFMKSPYFSIIVGDIVDDDIIRKGDVVVLPSNPMMRPGGGVSGAIFKKAGVDILEGYAMNKYGISYEEDNRENEMKVGEVRITPGFEIPVDIIWVRGPRVWDYPDDKYYYSEQLLLETYKNVLRFAYEQGYSSVILPSIGTGSYGFEHRYVGRKVSKVINDFLFEIEDDPEYEETFQVVLVLNEECNKKYYVY